MDKFTIRKEIAALINSIKEHSDNIGNKEQIPQLELELILHKIEKLYQKSIVFNYMNSLPQIRETKQSEGIADTVEAKAEKPVVDPPKQETKSEPIRPLEKTVVPVDLFGSELSSPVEKPKPEKKTEKKENPSVDKAEKPIISKIQKPAITDLKSAIGINDKFQFANELFEGNMQEYNIAIQQLNSAETIESAMDYFSSLQQLYDWNPDNETLKRLLDLVDRRYS